MPTLADLPKSPERKVLEACVALLRADALLAAVFRPIRMLETPSLEGFINYGPGEMVIQPVPVKASDHPSKRSTSVLGVEVAAYLAMEQREEDSKLVGQDLGSYLRKLLWGRDFMDPDNPGFRMNFATTSFKYLPALLPVVATGSMRILRYRADFELDVDPTTGGFSA